MTHQARTTLLRHQVAQERPYQEPSAELMGLMDRLELLAGIPGTTSEREQVAEKIMDTFARYPGDAPTWQAMWRRLHEGRTR